MAKQGQQLLREDLKIVYFPLDPANEEMQGCSIVHRKLGLGAVSEAATMNARENLLAAVGQLADKMGVPVDQAKLLFHCPTCQQEHLPKVEGWNEEHHYQYSKKVTVSVGEHLEAHLFCYVNREVGEAKWQWQIREGASERAEPLAYDEEFFIEDAFLAADKAASMWANEQYKEEDDGDEE
jgi:hypothetical protein